jgi:hypothetical protein
MDGHKRIECRICLKTMRSDHLRRHMKRNDHKPYQKVEIEYNSKLDVVALENEVISEWNEFMRKLELGRGINEIVLKLNTPTAGLSAEHREALELFRKHGICKG